MRIAYGLALILAISACATVETIPASGALAHGGADASAGEGESSPTAITREQRFRAWIAAFWADAARAGISESTLTAALGVVSLRPQVIKLGRSQPEFARRIWDYLDTAVSQARIDRGRAQMARYRQAVNGAAERFGIPPEILVAIWGMESSYGGYTGNISTLDALGTLAFEGRRREFARGELLAALEILDHGAISVGRMRGSWAGAMGQTQFLPTSYQRYAVDGDGDGSRDIWNSVADALASTANYLSQAGWCSGEVWGVEVRLPQDFDYALARLGLRKATREWARLGVRSASGGTLPRLDAASSIIVPAGARGPAFLVGHNFRVIMEYNAAVSYALAVVHLADRISGGRGFVASWPRALAAMSREQIKTMQRLLNQQGFAVGAVDGMVGPNTRAGLRAFQRSQGLVGDGYPTHELLQLLRHSG